jgi:heme/copper-type cytochrome/quinol oxidase subunit 3
MVIRWIAAWLAILVLAVLNGVVREALLLPRLGRTGAYLASGLILSAVIVLVASALARWMRLAGAAGALRAGVVWLAMTLVFELGFGIVQGKPWPEILSQYTFTDGNIWPLVLAVVLFAPWVGWRLRGAS